MKAADRRAQVEAVLTSDLDEAAKVVWTYLLVIGRLGRDNLADRLQIVDIDDALEILAERQLVKKKAGTYMAVPFLLEQREVETREPTSLRLVADELLDQYNRVRSSVIHAPVARTDRVLAKFEELAGWLNETGIEFQPFLEWARKKTVFLQARKPPVPFITPELLCGPWLKEQWMSEPPVMETPKHAGKTYQQPKGLKERLVAAGFARCSSMNREDERFVQNYVESMEVDPIHFPRPHPDWVDEIKWLLQQRGAGNADGSRS